MGMNEIKTVLGSAWLLLSDGIDIKQGCWGLVCHVVCLITATLTETKKKKKRRELKYNKFFMLIGKIRLEKKKIPEEFLFSI